MLFSLKIGLLFSLFFSLLTSFASSAEQICRVCHTEETLSIPRPCPKWQEHAHPVYVVPSSKITIPDMYPLNEKGEIFCGTCHMPYIEPGSGNRQGGPAGQVFLLGENTDSSMCKLCHTEKVAAQLQMEDNMKKYDKILAENFQPDITDKFDIGSKAFFNHPVDIISPRMPRQIEAHGGEQGMLKDQVICQSCHKMHKVADRDLLIVDNSRNELCGFCHAPMFGLSREDTTKKGTHPVNVIPSTSTLSRMVTLEGGRLGKERQIICLTCHSIHQANVEKGLLIQNNSNSSLCFKCHLNILESLTGTKHDLSVSAPKAKNVLGQNTGEGGLCSSCHLVHHGQGAKMWARKIKKKSEKQDIISRLCTTCHASGEIASKTQVGRFTHPTGIDISHADKRYVRLPLFSPSGAPLGQGEVTCATCHNVHRWSPDSTQGTTNILEKGNASNSFLRVANIESSLCRECHLVQENIQGTSHDFTLPIYSNSLTPRLLRETTWTDESRQKQKGKGICQFCHTAHNAISVKLWARQLGPGEDPISQICSSCHSEGMVAEHKQTGPNSHPINVSIQKLGDNFRSDLPLFTDNLNRDEAGKIFCNTCHNTHQWDSKVSRPGSGKIKEGTSQNSFLRKTANNAEDPLCENCHQDVGLVRDTEHDLRISAPGEKNPQGKTTDQSGVCSPCHAVHNATHSYYLWSKKLGPGTDFISRACNSCHWEGRSASGKTTGQYSHPIDRSSFSVVDDVKSLALPVFDSSLRPVNADIISSLSPLHIDSLKTQQNIEESKEQKNWLDFLKRRYIETRRRKNKIKERLAEILKTKQEWNVKMNTDKSRIKKLSMRIAKANNRYQKTHDKTETTKLKITILKQMLKTLNRKIKQLKGKTTHPPGFNQLGPGKAPGSGPAGGDPGLIKNNPLNNTSPLFPGSGNAKNPAKSLTEKKKRENLRRQAQLERFEKDKEVKSAELEVLEKKDIKKLTSIYKKLAKSLEEDKTETKKLKKNFKLLLKRFKGLSVEQHRSKKLFEDLRNKLADLQEEIEEIAPTSFILMQGTREDVLAKASFMDELDMDFRRKFFELKNDYSSTVKSLDQIREKYSGLRIKYKDILFYPDKKRKTSILELEDLLREGLAEDLERDVDIEPQGKILCNTCHNVHQWDPDKKETGPGRMTEGDFSNSFLRISNDGGYRLCVACHKNKDLIEGTDHDLAVSAPEEKNILGQTPAKAGLCGNCHLVHNAASGFNIWARKIDNEIVNRLLQFRNESKKLERQVEHDRIKFRKAAKTYRKRLGKYTKIRKSDEKIKKRREKILNRMKKTEQDMQNLPPAQQKISQRKIANYKKQLRFLNNIVDSSEEKRKKPEGKLGKIYNKLKKDRNTIKKNIARIEELSKAITSMEEEFRRIPYDSMSLVCRTCHEKEQCAQTKKLAGFNHPLDVALVFPETIPEYFEESPKKKESEKKEKKIQEEKKTKDELIRKLYDYPLYTKQGDREYEEGKIYCPTCHDPHQWDPTNHTKGDGLLKEGDARNSFLRMENFPSPKLCSGCHPQQARLAGTNHDLSISAPHSTNPRGQTVAESGVCGVCHVTHNGKDKNYLGHIGPGSLASRKQDWAGKKDRSVQKCTGCHNPDGAIASKSALHPQGKGYTLLEVKTLLANPKFPYTDYLYKDIKRKLGIRNIREGAAPKITLFDKEGTHSTNGNITCLTCHNPHAGSIKDEMQEKNGEKTVITSFLKEDIASRFCSDCHGVSSIYSFAFFHKNRNRLPKQPPKKTRNPHWRKTMDAASCTSADCHQDSVHGNYHQVNVEAASKRKGLKLPEELPLVNGKIGCVTCHDPKLQTGKLRFLKEKNPFFIRGIYENLLKKEGGQKVENTPEGRMVDGPPQITGLMAGPRSFGGTGGLGGGANGNRKKAKAAREKTRKNIKKARLLKVQWDRYQICYYCHIEGEYQRFTPHQSQLDTKGNIKEEVCLICHTKIPDRKKIAESNFFLIKPIEDMCRGCHNGYETGHPAGKDHFGKMVASDLAKNARTAIGVLATFIPLHKQKLVCSSCHNPHATDVVQVPIAAKGATDKDSRLRMSGQKRCGLCHGSDERERSKGIGYSPF